MRRLALAAMLLAAGCSSDWEYELSLAGVPPNRTGMIGDTLRIVATEHATDPHGVDTDLSSADHPDQFTWASTNPTVAEFVSSGVLVLHQGGEVVLSIRAPHTKADFVFAVAVKPKVIIVPTG
jgi:hypothetical protein